MSVELDSITQLQGIGRKTLEKLKFAGFTPELIAVSPVRVIAREADISEVQAAKIAEYIRSELMSEDSFITARDYWEYRKNIERISTGCGNLDKLLMGGIETRAITELIGEFGAGKTQICHQLAVTVQLPRDKGGLEAKALYIDAEGTFRPERVIQISKRFGLNPDEVLENIVYARAFNSDHQMLLVKKAFEIIKEENIKLVVVDSIISHFRSEYPGRENLASRQQKLNAHISDLLKLCSVFNLAVVVTNQVVASPDVFFGNPIKPAGGHVLAHGCTYRVFLKKSREGKRIARIIDSPCHPEREVVFFISTEGVVDP
ncbi:MAG: DNA repair and recombination protein RadA [Thermoprotei archaeon]|nr:MAG: DNA repair and recombination protein RadA [Thermoprotei archaeon]